MYIVIIEFFFKLLPISSVGLVYCVSVMCFLLLSLGVSCMIKNVLKRRREGGTYLASDSRHRWRVQMMMKNDR